jgi:hypothetical protein
MKFPCRKSSLLYMLSLLPLAGVAQTGTTPTGNTVEVNKISTTVGFLNISPDSRSGAMGEAGVAISPDVNANFWNPAKLAFIGGADNSISLSHSPWLRQLTSDVSLSYLSYSHRLDDRNTIGASLRYFNLGLIQLTDTQGGDQGTYRPTEFSLDGSFARKFGDDFSLGLTLRWIHSDLSDFAFATGSSQTTKASNSVAADISMYHKSETQLFGKDAMFAYGVNISNIGTKTSYSDVGQSYFLPANLKIGVANTLNIDDFNQVTFALDFNKLLVPTPPTTDANGLIISGKDNNVSVPAGIFGSFTDAPGGFSEELKEISISPGVEYLYDQQFAIRGGYFYSNPLKGGGRYLTLGVGLKYDVYRFDFSYLAASQQSSPLANTLRFTLAVNFGGNK